jgi:hypothetical protein
MTVTYKSCNPSDRLVASDRFRATWAATRAGAELPVYLGGADIVGVTRYLFEDGIPGTHMAIGISQPAVSPGDHATTLALQIVTGGVGRTVAQLATALQDAVPDVRIPIVTMGDDLQLVTLERYQAGQGAAADAAAIDQATAEASDITEHTGLAGAAEKVGHTLQTALYIAAAVAALYVLTRFGTGRGGVDWG